MRDPGELGVGLVDADQAGRFGHDPLDGRRVEGVAGRVVGVADDDELRARGDGVEDAVGIELEVGP